MKITFSNVNLPNGEFKYLSQAIMQHVSLKTHRGSYTCIKLYILN